MSNEFWMWLCIAVAVYLAIGVLRVRRSEVGYTCVWVNHGQPIVQAIWLILAIVFWPLGPYILLPMGYLSDWWRDNKPSWWMQWQERRLVRRLIKRFDPRAELQNQKTGSGSQPYRSVGESEFRPDNAFGLYHLDKDICQLYPSTIPSVDSTSDKQP